MGPTRSHLRGIAISGGNSLQYAVPSFPQNWHSLNQEWMEQIARSTTQESWGDLGECRYALYNRDTKFCASFRSVLAEGGVEALPSAGRQSESECLCGTSGSVCQARVSVEADSVR